MSGTRPLTRCNLVYLDGVLVGLTNTSVFINKKMLLVLLLSAQLMAQMIKGTLFKMFTKIVNIIQDKYQILVSIIHGILEMRKLTLYKMNMKSNLMSSMGHLK